MLILLFMRDGWIILIWRTRSAVSVPRFLRDILRDRQGPWLRQLLSPLQRILCNLFNHKNRKGTGLGYLNFFFWVITSPILPIYHAKKNLPWVLEVPFEHCSHSNPHGLLTSWLRWQNHKDWKVATHLKILKFFTTEFMLSNFFVR